MIILGQNMRRKENADLVKAMYGFGFGSHVYANCGIVIGGVSLISLYRGDLPGEEETEVFIDMIKDFINWFKVEYGSIDCKNLVKDNKEDMISNCSAMLAESFNYIMTLLTNNGIEVNL